MKFKLFKFDIVVSTNDTAINLIKKKKKENGIIYSEVQTKGRGTHGKKWISDKGNLFASIFFSLKEDYPPFSEFFLVNPVIISSVIANYSSKNKISLKSPNDIFLNKKKICGILQEQITFKDKKFLVIGVGINIKSSPTLNNKSKYKTTNLLSETKKQPTIEEIIKKTASSYESFFHNLDTYNYESFKNKANSMVLK